MLFKNAKLLAITIKQQITLANLQEKYYYIESGRFVPLDSGYDGFKSVYINFSKFPSKNNSDYFGDGNNFTGPVISGAKISYTISRFAKTDIIKNKYYYYSSITFDGTTNTAYRCNCGALFYFNNNYEIQKELDYIASYVGTGYMYQELSNQGIFSYSEPTITVTYDPYHSGYKNWTDLWNNTPVSGRGVIYTI